MYRSFYFRPMFRGIALSMICLGMFGCGSADNASKQNMHKLHVALLEYSMDHNDAWPDRLDQIKDRVGGEATFNELMKNPLTGDDPGYEYVKPQTGSGAKPLCFQIIIYQLRDGKRDMTLNVGYADGAVCMEGELIP